MPKHHDLKSAVYHDLYGGKPINEDEFDPRLNIEFPDGTQEDLSCLPDPSESLPAALDLIK
jgi:hypothetical protein